MHREAVNGNVKVNVCGTVIGGLSLSGNVIGEPLPSRLV